MDSDETVVGGAFTGTAGSLPAGTQIGEYRVLNLLGRGAMGQVYEVEQVRMGRRYALKLLPQELQRDAEFRRRFEQEARTLAGLEHANIVQVVYAGESPVGGQPHAYLVMELLRPLTELLTGESVPEEETVRLILQQVLSALDYAHGRGVVHRDLKPANLLLTETGEIKIGDFGVAQVVGSDFMRTVVERTVAESLLGDAATVVGSSTKGSSGYVGTIHYMAPEVVAGGEATAQSDLYAVGVMAYEWLTGRKPVGRAKAIGKLRKDLAADWDDWVDALLEYEPGERMTSANAALAVLPQTGRSVSRIPAVVSASMSDGTASTPSLVRNVAPGSIAPAIPLDKSSQRTTVFVLIILGVLAAGGLIGYQWWGGQEARKPVIGQNAVVELPDGVPLDLIWIPPGEFVMGSPSTEEGRLDNEGPQTHVHLTNGFWLGKAPVTQGQWQALMGNNPSTHKDSGLNAPVESVSWDDAMSFARKLTERERSAGRLPDGYVYTLPSEAQWEYACRAPSTSSGQAGTSTRYYSGNSESDLGRAGWYHGNSGGKTHVVGEKEPNDWGLYDMHGNVWEWTRSWFGAYPGGSVVDYEGPRSGSNRARRGGSWGSSAQGTRSAIRNWSDPASQWNGLGFRIALAPSP